MDKKKKRLAKGLVAAALVGVIAVGSTLAYLSANTGQKTNKFTGAKIEGSTEENFIPPESYLTGQNIEKQPWIQIKAGSAKANVAIVVDYIGDDGNTKLSQEEFKRYAEVKDWNLGEEGSATWRKVADSKDGKSELYIYNEVVDASTSKQDVSTQFLFNSVTVNPNLRTVTDADKDTTQVYSGKNKTGLTDFSKVTDTIAGTYYYDQNNNVLIKNNLPEFTIDVSGFAVQSENLGDSTASAELTKLANEGRTGNQQF